MERVTANFGRRASQGVRRVTGPDGRAYLVAPLTLISPGVLNGSKGPLYYPPDETAKNVGDWSQVPLVVYHPTKDGANVSASTPGVWDDSGIGFLRKPTFNGKLRAQGWFDEERTREYDERLPDAVRLLPRLERGEPIELSTGLYTDNQPVENGVDPKTGTGYTHVARNHRPDHVAVLPDQRGACAVDHGCGINVNASKGDFDSDEQRRAFFGLLEKGGAAPTGTPPAGSGTTPSTKKVPDADKTGFPLIDAAHGKTHSERAKAAYDSAGKIGLLIHADPQRGHAVLSQVVKSLTKGSTVKDREDMAAAMGLKGITGAKATESAVAYRITERASVMARSHAGSTRDPKESVSLALKELHSHGYRDPTTNAVPNQPKSLVSGQYKPLGSGTGKGECHEAAQAGAMTLTDSDLANGKDAAHQLMTTGHNPPNWVADEPKWEKAKAAAGKGDYEEGSDTYWAVVSHVYEKMGGAKKATTENVETTTNTEGNTVPTRKQNIEYLTTNCSCSGYDKADEAILNKFTDEKLGKLRAVTEKAVSEEVVANAAKAGFASDGKQFKFCPDSGTFVSNAMSAADKEDTMDGGDDEDEEDAEGNLKKTKKKGPPTPPTGNQGKTMNMKEWLKLAPPEAEAVWNSAVRVHDRERAGVIARLTEIAETTTNENKKKLITNKLNSNPPLTTDRLTEVLELADEPTDNSSVGGMLLPSYGGGAAPTGNANGGYPALADDDMLLPPMVANFAGGDDEEE